MRFTSRLAWSPRYLFLIALGGDPVRGHRLQSLEAAILMAAKLLGLYTSLGEARAAEDLGAGDLDF
jgi:hypothetical protein